MDEAAFAPRDRPDGTAAREPALDLLPRWRPILPRAWRHLDAAGILAAVVDGAGMPPGRRAA